MRGFFMKNIVLEFDKRNITKEEMIEHINYYATKSNEAMQLCSDGKLKEAREIFKDLRGKLQLEYKYYDKVSVRKYVHKNNYYNTDVARIRQAYVKQNRPNSNETLHSNLYDIYDYISNYEMRIFFEE